MKKYAFLMLVLLVSCKSKDSMIKQDVQYRIDNSSAIDSLGTEVSLMRHEVNQLVISWKEVTSNVNASWNKKIYSDPDSTGKQFLKSEETGNLSGKSNHVQKDSIAYSSKLEELTKEIRLLSERISTMENQMSNVVVKEKSKKWYDSFLMCSGALFWCVVVFFVLKRIRSHES